MSYLLDTCVISDFFRKIPAVIGHFESTLPDQIHISSITAMEIEYGLKLNQERERKIRPLWESLLSYVEVISYSSNCAIASATVRVHLKELGLPIGPYDVLIAGTALAHHMTMVTSNSSEFQRVTGLIVEDWRN